MGCVRVPRGALQAASQQGFYLGRLFSKNFNLTSPIPERNGPPVTPGELLMVGEKRDNGKSYATGFQFLNLGTLAYTGGDRYEAQFSVCGSGNARRMYWEKVGAVV